jgi:hypothetical protein
MDFSFADKDSCSRPVKNSSFDSLNFQYLFNLNCSDTGCYLCPARPFPLCKLQQAHEIILSELFSSFQELYLVFSYWTLLQKLKFDFFYPLDLTLLLDLSSTMTNETQNVNMTL